MGFDKLRRRYVSGYEDPYTLTSILAATDTKSRLPHLLKRAPRRQGTANFPSTVEDRQNKAAAALIK
jgi:hypothetical protein